MPSLLDIMPATRQIKVGDQLVDVYGISAEGVAALLSRFPSVQKAMTGFAHQIKPEEMARLIPEAIPALIAAGCGNLGDKKAEKNASQLPLPVQLDFIEAIMEITLPGGVGPFVERLTRLGLVAGEQSQKALATISPQGSKSSSPEGTTTQSDTRRSKSADGSTSKESASAAST